MCNKAPFHSNMSMQWQLQHSILFLPVYFLSTRTYLPRFPSFLCSYESTTPFSKTVKVRVVIPQALLSFSLCALDDSSVFNVFWPVGGWGSTTTICSGTSSWRPSSSPCSGAHHFLSHLMTRGILSRTGSWTGWKSCTETHMCERTCLWAFHKHSPLVSRPSLGAESWYTRIKTGLTKHTNEQMQRLN